MVGFYFIVLKIFNSSQLFLYNLFMHSVGLIQVLIYCLKYRTPKMKECFRYDLNSIATPRRISGNMCIHLMDPQLLEETHCPVNCG